MVLADRSAKPTPLISNNGIAKNRQAPNRAGDFPKAGSFMKQYAPWMIAGLAGASLFLVDGKIKKISQRPGLHNDNADDFFVPVHILGMGWQYAVSIPLLAGHGLAYKNNKSLLVAEELAAGLIADGVATGTLKLGFGRLRPYQNNSPSEFFEGGVSFVSGDVSTAFAFATIISKEYPSQNLGILGNHKFPLVPALAYSTAGLVGLQRLYSNNHWSSVVFYGAITGYAVGTIVVHFGKKIHLKGFAITPGQPARITATFGLFK
jgi:membrane-associated phospholipid phosphatase